MGKRASKRKPAKKQRQLLQRVFNCIFCAHENSIDIEVDKSEKVGYLHCKVCGVTFECPVHSLSAPIDVYAEWVDRSEAVNSGVSGKATDKSQSSPLPKSGASIEERDDSDPELQNNTTMADLLKKAAQRSQSRSEATAAPVEDA